MKAFSVLAGRLHPLCRRFPLFIAVLLGLALGGCRSFRVEEVDTALHQSASFELGGFRSYWVEPEHEIPQHDAPMLDGIPLGRARADSGRSSAVMRAIEDAISQRMEDLGMEPAPENCDLQIVYLPVFSSGSNGHGSRQSELALLIVGYDRAEGSRIFTLYGTYTSEQEFGPRLAREITEETLDQLDVFSARVDKGIAGLRLPWKWLTSNSATHPDGGLSH